MLMFQNNMNREKMKLIQLKNALLLFGKRLIIFLEFYIERNCLHVSCGSCKIFRGYQT